MEMAQLLEQTLRGHAAQGAYAELRDDISPEATRRIRCIEGKTMGWVEHNYKLPDDLREQEPSQGRSAMTSLTTSL